MSHIAALATLAIIVGMFLIHKSITRMCLMLEKYLERSEAFEEMARAWFVDHDKCDQR